MGEQAPRWKGVERDYSAEDVVKLRGTVMVEHTLARLGAEKLWRLVNQEKPLCALGGLTGNQAIQEIQAGLKAIYCSGWQVAVTATAPARCIRIRVSTRPIRFPRWCSGSTTHSCAPTKFMP